MIQSIIPVIISCLHPILHLGLTVLTAQGFFFFFNAASEIFMSFTCMDPIDLGKMRGHPGDSLESCK